MRAVLSVQTHIFVQNWRLAVLQMHENVHSTLAYPKEQMFEKDDVIATSVDWGHLDCSASRFAPGAGRG